MQQKEDIIDEGQREHHRFRGYLVYSEQSYLVYECRTGSFNFSSGKITKWKSTCTFNYLRNSDLNVSLSTLPNLMPVLENNGRMNVKFNGYYFAHNKALHLNTNKVVNIYIVYRLDSISRTRNIDYAIQNALFGTIKVTKNATDSSKNKYEGYGICFNEGSSFSKGNIFNGKKSHDLWCCHVF